jgi:hypothetical protein
MAIVSIGKWRSQATLSGNSPRTTALIFISLTVSNYLTTPLTSPASTTLNQVALAIKVQLVSKSTKRRQRSRAEEYSIFSKSTRSTTSRSRRRRTLNPSWSTQSTPLEERSTKPQRPLKTCPMSLRNQESSLLRDSTDSTPPPKTPPELQLPKRLKRRNEDLVLDYRWFFFWFNIL